MTARTTFWTDKRVFLTGHTGFKGTWAAAWLLEMGALVRGFALAPTDRGVPEGQQSFFDEMGLADRMDHVVGDVRDGSGLRAALEAFDPEVVLHMAAQPLVRLSYREPVQTYATNVMGTVNLLDACRALPSLRAVVVVTSDKCYENKEQIWGYREGDAMGGHDPYSNSKGCAELVTAAYRDSFFPADRIADHGVVVASGRAGNVIGGGDWSEDRLVPDAMRAFLSGETLVIRKPAAVRPWQHVLDPVSGYLRVVEKAAEAPEVCAQGWNFGPPDAMNLEVGDVVAGVARRLGSGFRWEARPSADDVHEATLLRLDCTAARLKLGWRPLFDADAMLAMTTDWYRAETPDARRQTVQDQLAQAAAECA